jgi:CDP-paratose 2-epimerase
VRTDMAIALITGSGGLVGSEAVRHFAGLGLDVIGIDNDMRKTLFGEEASTAWNVARLRKELGFRYRHLDIDVRDRMGVLSLFEKHRDAIVLVIHAASQPSHDWAAREPFTDFDINATGTLNLLEATRRNAPDATFIYTSTNKVYGDRPNDLPLIELESRFEISPDHTYANGIREDMRIDDCLHSLFGASKLAGDIMVQEYGRYFGISTVCFRGGTLTGPAHSATELHGFLAYVMRCTMSGRPYTVYGYGGKQVRDAIHSSDLVRAFQLFFEQPRVGELYNIGGGRSSNCSVIEAIELSQEITGKKLDWQYSDHARRGDHVWWIGDNGKFEDHYPGWHMDYDVPRILKDIHETRHAGWST